MARKKMYKNLKLVERMARFVETLGYTEIDSRNKYRMFAMAGKDKEGKSYISYLFLGSNGAVRSTVDSKNAAKSFSRTEKFQKALEQYENYHNLMESTI